MLHLGKGELDELGTDWRILALGAGLVILAIALFVVLAEDAPGYEQASCLPAYTVPIGAPVRVYHCSGFSHTVYDVVRVVTWVVLSIGLTLVALTARLLLGRPGGRRTGAGTLAVGASLVVIGIVGYLVVRDHPPFYQYNTCRPVHVIQLTPTSKYFHCSGLPQVAYDAVRVLMGVLLAIGLIAMIRARKLLLARPPWFWGLLYLAMIPFWAWVYTTKADEFYDSNLSREPASLSHQMTVENMLSNVLEAHADRSAEITYDRTKWFISGNTYVQNVSVTPGSSASAPSFEVQASVGLETVAAYLAGYRTETNTSVPLWFRLDYQTETIRQAQSVALYSAELTGPGGQGAPAVGGASTIFGALLPEEPSDPAARLDLGQYDDTSLSSLYPATTGDPSAAPGIYWRMVYLSATVVTTLGIGDVQPIGTASRLFVTAEAILGVLFAGLFLNALARRYRRGDEPPAPLGESSR